MAETFQKGVLFTIKGHITKFAKPPNAEPQGCPEALDRSYGKLTKHRQLLKPFRNGCFFPIERPHGKIKKSPNAEPQGIPEALDRLVGMLIEFSTISRRQGLKPFRKVGGWVD